MDSNEFFQNKLHLKFYREAKGCSRIERISVEKKKSV